MIDALEQTDKYMIGIRTYIYVLCCQLNEAVTPFKRKYVDAYVVFCKFMQLEMKKEKKSKDNDYPYAAVGTTDIEKKIIKRYFEAKSSETKFQPFTTIAENPNIEDTATTAVQTFLNELSPNTHIALAGNANDIKGCVQRIEKPKFQLYNADSEEIPEEIPKQIKMAKIDNNDDGSGSEGEPYKQVYEVSDDENVDVPETEISQMPKFKPDPEINVPDRPIGTFAEEIQEALGWVEHRNVARVKRDNYWSVYNAQAKAQDDVIVFLAQNRSKVTVRQRLFQIEEALEITKVHRTNLWNLQGYYKDLEQKLTKTKEEKVEEVEEEKIKVPETSKNSGTSVASENSKKRKEPVAPTVKKPAVVKDKKVKTTPTVAAPKQTSGEIFFQLDDKGRSQIVRDRNYKPTVVEIDLVEEDSEKDDDLKPEEEADFDYCPEFEVGDNGTKSDEEDSEDVKKDKTGISGKTKNSKKTKEIPTVTPNIRNKKIQITLEGVTVASATIGSSSVPISTPTTSTITENSGNSKNSGISGNSTEIFSKSSDEQVKKGPSVPKAKIAVTEAIDSVSVPTFTSATSKETEIPEISKNSGISGNSMEILDKSTGTESKEVPGVPKAAEAVSGTIGSISAPSSTSTSTSSSEKSEISENSGISRNSTVNVGDKAASDVRNEATVEVESVVASVSTGETSAPVKPVRVPLWKR